MILSVESDGLALYVCMSFKKKCVLAIIKEKEKERERKECVREKKMFI
jgi:hypothetical protein